VRGKRGLPAALLALALGCAPFLDRPAWERPPPPVRDAPVVQPGALERAALPNGLHVLVLEDHRIPRVVLGLALRRGEAMLAPERAGLAVFTGDLMERGAGTRDAVALAQAVDAIGASFYVWTGWDEMSVFVSGLSRDLDRLMEILADVVLRPRFERREATRLRSEQIASLQKAKDDPGTLANWFTQRTLYPEHRFGVPLGGTPETLERFDERAAREFHARVFVPNDAVLFASGDLEADDVLNRARGAFGAWRPEPVPDAGPAPPERAPEARRIVVVDRPDLVQARITIAHEGIARTDPDRIAVALMNSVIGGSGFSSRLTQTVRADAGLTYGIRSGFALRREPGPFTVTTFTRVPETRRVVDLVLAELGRARSQPPSEKELRDARALAIGTFSLGLETSDAVMTSLVDLDVYGLPPDSLDTYRARVRATDAEQVARMAREHLHPERAAIVLVGPAELLVPQFEDLGPVTVRTP
jgi:zinc protease